MGAYSLWIIFQLMRAGHYSDARSTSVWWETKIDPKMVFGIPMIANIGVKEKRLLEKFQLEPDIRATLPYDALINGKDTQIEVAVREMLRVIGEGGR